MFIFIDASIAATGSSAMISFGRVISARAIDTRCSSPPENCVGYLPLTTAQRHADAACSASLRPVLPLPCVVLADAQPQRRVEQVACPPSCAREGFVRVLEDRLNVRSLELLGLYAPLVGNTLAVAAEIVPHVRLVAARRIILHSVDLPQPDSPTIDRITGLPAVDRERHVVDRGQLLARQHPADAENFAYIAESRADSPRIQIPSLPSMWHAANRPGRTSTNSGHSLWQISCRLAGSAARTGSPAADSSAPADGPECPPSGSCRPTLRQRADQHLPCTGESGR